MNNSKRYYLHRRLKMEGVRYDPYQKTIYWIWNQPCENKYALRLRDSFGYSIQLEIN